MNIKTKNKLNAKLIFRPKLMIKSKIYLNKVNFVVC